MSISEIPINLVFEDSLSGSVLKRLLAEIRKRDGRQWYIGEYRNTNGKGWIESRIGGLNNAARGMPYLVLVDLNAGYRCAPELVDSWIGGRQNPNLLLRVAVREVESWILASGDVFCRYLGVSSGSIPKFTDDIPNPKEFLISLAKKSRKKNMRLDIVPRAGSTAKKGPDYNGRLIRFVSGKWNPCEAAENSDSLKRTIRKLRDFIPVLMQKEK